MPSSTTIAQKNRSLHPKTQDIFLVSFYNIAENDSNIMGRQVKSFERPPINFKVFQTDNKGIKQVNNATLEFSEVSVIFEDDENSLVNKALINQCYRQAGKGTDDTKYFENSKFEINCKLYNGRDTIVEDITLRGCFIVNITHSEAITSDNIPNTITTTISFDNLDYVFPVIGD